MGCIMAVQAIQQQNDAVNIVQIPTKVPKEVIENEGLMALEKSVNKLEDRVVITAKTVLGINTELKNQIFEIDRIEETITSMHEFMVFQQEKIERLEFEVSKIKRMKSESNDETFDSKPGFWARLFSK
jgi:uncharacterized coiled-coil protein SlyX